MLRHVDCIISSSIAVALVLVAFHHIIVIVIVVLIIVVIVIVEYYQIPSWTKEVDRGLLEWSRGNMDGINRRRIPSQHNKL